MDKITERLLAIESEARQAMNDINNDIARIRKKAAEELAERLVRIEREVDQEITRLRLEADKDAAERAERVKEEYRRKDEELEAEFDETKEIRRREIFNEVLYG